MEFHQACHNVMQISPGTTRGTVSSLPCFGSLVRVMLLTEPSLWVTGPIEISLSLTLSLSRNDQVSNI